ncbi:MFS transporter [Rhodobacterales bacterium 52_120_T64]|nr:MFS transporter [Rhodobacterales bacterium 52_120_T64]
MSLLAFARQNARWLAAGALLAFMSSFGQTFFISVFSDQIRTEFGLTHAMWGGIYSLGTTASALVMIWAGTLTDIFRTRSIGVVVFLLLGLACLAMASVPTVLALPFIIFALRLLGQGMSSHLSVVAMSRWFVAGRGRALSISSFGFSIGETFLPISFVFLMSIYSWRSLWVASFAILMAAIPVLLLLLRRERTPQSMAQESMSLGMKDRHWTRRDMLRHPLFWFMIPALLGPSAFSTAFFFQQAHFAEIKGLEHLQLVSFFPIYSVLSVIVMFVSGVVLDRLGSARLLPFYQLPMVIAFACFSLAQSSGMVALGLTFLAVTSGANSTLPNAFWAEFYGTKYLGAIKSLAAAVMVLGSAIGPGLTGLLIDSGFALDQQYLWISLFFLISSGAMTIGVFRARSDLKGFNKNSIGDLG